MANHFIYDDKFGDPSNNWLIYNRLAKEKPKSFLELGCGTGFMVWRFDKVAKVKNLGFDNNKLFKIFRATNNLQLCNYSTDNWTIDDGSYDFLYSFGIVDDLPDSCKNHFLKELKRVGKRGFHIVRDKNFINYLPSNHKVFHESEFVAPFYDFPEYYVKNNLDFPLNPDLGIYENFTNTGYKINFGSGACMATSCWHNFDIKDYYELAHTMQFRFDCFDVAKKTCLDNNCDKNFVAVNLPHILDCIEIEKTKDFLNFCFKNIMPGGFIRVSTFDYNKIYQSFFNGNIDDNFLNLLVKDRFSVIVENNLIDLLDDAGFSKIKISSFNNSNFDIFNHEIIDTYPDFSNYVEARKFIF